MCCFYHTSNTINLVTASVDASVGIVEHTIFIPDVVDGRAPAHGVIFAKYVAQITKQQGRYAVRHGLSPLGNRASLSRCMPRRKVAAQDPTAPQPSARGNRCWAAGPRMIVDRRRPRLRNYWFTVTLKLIANCYLLNRRRCSLS